MTANFIIPPYLLENLVQTAPSDESRARWQQTLDHDHTIRAARAAAAPTTAAAEPRAGEGPDRVVYDAGNGTDLPGEQVRAEGEPDSRDTAVNQAYDGTGATWTMLKECFGRDSVDGAGLPLKSTVHYDRAYNNAFWNGEQMVFGDGDGEIFESFTNAVDVTGHELTHGVTQFTAGLDYQGQAGALNESISDVFGSLTKQYALGQTAEEADWIIGAGLFKPDVKGVGLRSMKAPGTAYDDPRLGKDPQPDSMDGYVETSDDNGGVHINSGIPNRAFYLTATKIGGHAWEGAGKIWYQTITGGKLSSSADFAEFGKATSDSAKELFGEDSAELRAVTEAWKEVGVDPSGKTGPAGRDSEVAKSVGSGDPGRAPEQTRQSSQPGPATGATDARAALRARSAQGPRGRER